MRLLTMSLIGIGVGNSNHLTLEAIETLNRADLVLIPHKGEEKADLGILRNKICDQRLKNPDVRRVGFNLPERDPTIEDYRIRVDQWHNAIANCWWDGIDNCPDAGHEALLVWETHLSMTVRFELRNG